MLQLEEAIERILSAVPAPSPEPVPVPAAHGRFALEKIKSPIDLPVFTNSSMDGYAVRARDTQGATPQAPRALQLAGRIPAGSVFNDVLQPGRCARIFTGSPVPEGADAVVMQEATRTTPGSTQVEVLEEVEPAENLRFRGEDVRTDSVLVEEGGRITTGVIALLSATGVTTVSAGKRPRVGVLATGSELCEPGQPLRPGQIYESNRSALRALIKDAGAEPEVFPLVRDELALTREAVGNALNSSDILVTSGGVSVGEMDFLKAAVEQNGGELAFWKVAIKPGRPFVFGRCHGKLVFGLPGNPVSAVATFLLLVRPALLAWQGAKRPQLPCTLGIAAEQLENAGNRRHFLRVRLTEDARVYSAGLQASHALSSLAAANGLLDLAPGQVIREGENVRVLRWDW